MKRFESNRTLEQALLLAVSAVLFLVLPIIVPGETPATKHRSHGALPGLSSRGDAIGLKRTIVTASLREPLSKDENVIWCATFQSAWDELCHYFGGRIVLEGEDPLVKMLNDGLSKPEDLDPASSFVFAGVFTQAARNRLLTGLKAKFGSSSGFHILPPANKKEIVAYAYLRKDMPFKYRFNRSKLPFVFNGSNVASWNLLDGGTHPDVLKQVRLLDYVGPDSFVLEFHTRSAADRLILAKTPPGPTLKQTIDTVEKTLDIKGDTLSDTNMLVVPVLDFDLTKRYRQLENRRILAPASARRLDMRLFAARQRIEFRLDESGAELESEAYLSAGGVPEAGAAFLFDKPFLILIQRRGSPRPYFAAWIANADLMPRMPHATTTGSPGAATMNDKVHEMEEPNPSAEGIQRPSPNIMPAYLHPLRILHKSTPLYPPAGKAMGLNGSVVCQVLVSEDGHVQRARVLHSTDPIFNKAALDAARQFVFSQPTTPGGRRVKALQLLIFKFNQQRKETTGTKRKIPEAPTVN